MKKKLFKNLKTTFIFLLSITLCLSVLTLSVKADSGWDSDYGGGFDSDWGSDWGSDYDSDWGGGGIIFTGNPMIFFVIVVIIIIVALAVKKGNGASTSSYKAGLNIATPSISDEELSKYLGISKAELTAKIFDLYKNVQESWMDMDYEKMRKYTSDELFNTYKMQLETLKLKHQKNVMSDMELRNLVLTNINKTDDLITVTCEMIVAQKDYVVDASNNIVNGIDSRRMLVHYELTLTLTAESNNGKCPNCNAKIANQASNVCEYCGSTIVSSHHDLIMTKKQKKGQGWE